MPLLSEEGRKTLLSKVFRFGMGSKNPYVRKITINELNPNLRKFRFTDFPAIVEEILENYNASELVPGLLVGEGPIEEDEFSFYSNMKRFFELLFQQDVKTIVSLGLALEKGRKKFTEITGKPYTFCGYSVTSKPINVKNQYTDYTLNITNPAGKTREIALTHFDKIPDMEFIQSEPEAIQKLLALNQNIYRKKQAGITFAHCSAGLGRSGTFALISWLNGEYDQLLKLSEAERIDAIYNKWDEFNQQRPGTIQNLKQLANVFEIVDQMHQLNRKKLYRQNGNLGFLPSPASTHTHMKASTSCFDFKFMEEPVPSSSKAMTPLQNCPPVKRNLKHLSWLNIEANDKVPTPASSPVTAKINIRQSR